MEFTLGFRKIPCKIRCNVIRNWLLWTKREEEKLYLGKIDRLVAKAVIDGDRGVYTIDQRDQRLWKVGAKGGQVRWHGQVNCSCPPSVSSRRSPSFLSSSHGDDEKEMMPLA